MSSFGAQMRKRIAELQKAGEDVPRIIREVAEGATIEAVRVAEENTPPNGSEIAGTNTRSGQMEQHWGTDSQMIPTVTAGDVETTLANNMQYASYVNDGHRMDKHFVPGLIKNGNLIERVNPEKGGMMVGTKTEYVLGLYMKEKAIGRYRTVVRKELERRVKEHFR